MALQDYAGPYLGLAGNTALNTNGVYPVSYPPQPQVPSVPQIQTPNPFYFGPKRPTLSDFDIELMAACIANHHPVIDGQTHCFCMLKRLERGISKD